MENKVLKYNKKKFFIGLGGYFAGNILFELLGGEDVAYRLVAGVVVAGILWILSDLYDFKMNPSLKKKIRIEDKDERNQVIREKAGYFTLKVMIMTLFVIIFIGAVMEDVLISYGAAVLTILILIINWISIRYWNKRM